MQLLRDDPIIRSIQNTGYPPWMKYYDDDEDDDDDIFNCSTGEVMAVYDPE